MTPHLQGMESIYANEPVMYSWEMLAFVYRVEHGILLFMLFVETLRSVSWKHLLYCFIGSDMYAR